MANSNEPRLSAIRVTVDKVREVKEGYEIEFQVSEAEYRMITEGVVRDFSVRKPPSFDEEAKFHRKRNAWTHVCPGRSNIRIVTDRDMCSWCGRYRPEQEEESNIMLNIKEIENRFGHHKAKIEGESATLPRHTEMREKFMDLAEYLDDIITDNRAKAVMFTELETASMWAHKAIAGDATELDEQVSSLEPKISQTEAAEARDSLQTGKPDSV